MGKNRTRKPLVFLALSFLCMHFAAYGQATDSMAIMKKQLKPKRKKQSEIRAADDLFQPMKKSWSIGVNGGYPLIIGDIPPDFGIGYGLDLRKALGYSVSLRLQAITGYCTGYDWQKAGNSLLQSNLALNGTNGAATDYYNAKQYIYQNFRMDFTQVNFQVIYNINNVNFQRQNPWLNLYVFLGGGAMMYQTYIDQLDASGKMYDYSNIPDISKTGGSKSSVYSALKSKLDGKFETKADANINGSKLGSQNLVPVISGGLGVEFKLSDRISWSLELSYGFTGSDQLDGARWYGGGIPSAQADAFGYVSTGIHFRLGKTENAYWFANPLAMPYQTIVDSKRRLMRVDKMEKDLGDMKTRVDSMDMGLGALKTDRDSDGVSDYFDREDSTPVSSIVDGAGRTIFFRDADGNIVFNDPSADKNNTGTYDPDGTSYRKEDDGSKTKIMPDGTEYKESPDGNSYKTTKDGKKYRKSPEGKMYGVNGNGQEDEIQFDDINKSNPKVKVTRDKDGNTIKTYPDGTKYKIEKDGTIYKTYPDGSVYKKTKDGQVFAVNPNGNEDELEFKDATPNARKVRPANTKDKFDPKDLSNKITMLKGNGKGGYVSPGVSSAMGYMPAIFFETDRSDIKYLYYPELFTVANNLKSNPEIKVHVVGYCDYRSTEQYNMALGMRRANAVVNTLVNYFGVSSSQLIPESKGELEPLTNMKGFDALAANRRVQFVVGEGKAGMKDSKSTGPAKKASSSSEITPINKAENAQQSSGGQNGTSSEAVNNPAPVVKETPAPAKKALAKKTAVAKKKATPAKKEEPKKSNAEPDLYGSQSGESGTAAKKFNTTEPSSGSAVSTSEASIPPPPSVATMEAAKAEPQTAQAETSTPEPAVVAPVQTSTESAPATSTPEPVAVATTTTPASEASTSTPAVSSAPQDENTVVLAAGSLHKDKPAKKSKKEIEAEKAAAEKAAADKKAAEKKTLKEMKAAKKKADKERKKIEKERAKNKKKGKKEDKLENMTIPGE